MIVHHNALLNNTTSKRRRMRYAAYPRTWGSRIRLHRPWLSKNNKPDSRYLLSSGIGKVNLSPCKRTHKGFCLRGIFGIYFEVNEDLHTQHAGQAYGEKAAQQHGTEGTGESVGHLRSYGFCTRFRAGYEGTVCQEEGLLRYKERKNSK
jgi:hypothetical protein